MPDTEAFALTSTMQLKKLYHQMQKEGGGGERPKITMPA